MTTGAFRARVAGCAESARTDFGADLCAASPRRRAVRIGAGRHLASGIQRAKFIELDGNDHWAFAGDQQALLDNIRQFVGGLAG